VRTGLSAPDWSLPQGPKKKEEAPATATTAEAAAGAAAAADNGSSAPPTPTAATAAAVAPESPRELPSPLPKRAEEPRPVHDRHRTCIGWIKAFYQVVPGSRLPVSDVYQGYREDAQALGDQPVALLNFLQYLKEALPGVHTTLDLAAANGADATASGGVGGTQYIQNIGVRPARPMRSSIPVQPGAADKLSRPSTPPGAPPEPPAEAPLEPPTEATTDAAARTPASATAEGATEVTAEASAPEAKAPADSAGAAASAAAATVDAAAATPPPAADAAAQTLDAAKDTEGAAPQAAAAPAPMEVDANVPAPPAAGAFEQAAAAQQPPAAPEPSPAPEPEAAPEPNPAPQENPAPDAAAAAAAAAPMDMAEPEPAEPTEVWPCRWRGCDIGLALTSREALLEHLASAHRPAAPDHACQWATCTRTLPTATALLAHVQVHLPKHGVPPAAPPPAEPTTTEGGSEAPLTAAQLADIAAPAASAAAKAGGRAQAGVTPLSRMSKSTEPAGPAFLAALILQNMAAVATLRPLFVAQQSRLFEWAGTASRLASYSAAILAELETRPGSFTG